eukprot:scaffold56220_cov66-Phaeocystis_antarctica.AAC.2
MSSRGPRVYAARSGKGVSSHHASLRPRSPRIVRSSASLDGSSHHARPPSRPSPRCLLRQMDAASSTASSSALCVPVAGGGACAPPPGDVGVSVGASAVLAARLAARRRLRSMPSEHWPATTADPRPRAGFLVRPRAPLVCYLSPFSGQRESLSLYLSGQR